MAEEKTCTICFTDGPVSEGICCPRTHYTCADCFDAHVRNEAGKDLALLAKTDGRILCPRNTAANTAADRCDAAHFADKDIAAQVTHETFELYLDARSKLKEKAVAAEMEAQMNERLERERARAALGAGKEEKLRVAKEHVIETVLTLACPRCKQAFVDFDGCFALKCSRCAAAFCAYCLADCGRDAHAHVGTCPEGQASIKVAKKQKGVGGRALGGMPATVYGTKEAFDVAQHRRRCKHLAQYFEKFDEDGQRELLAALATELRDLHIGEKDVRKWQKKEAKAMQDRATAQTNAAKRQAPRPLAPPPGRRRGGGDGGARGLLDEVVNAAMMGVGGGMLGAIFHRRGGDPGAMPPPMPPAPRGGARRRRDHALQQHIQHIPGMNDDEFENLLQAGFFNNPPPPGGPQGLRGRPAGGGGPAAGAGPGAPHIAPLPGELPEGEIGPIRRARMERKRVEKEEAAKAAAERAKKAREEGPLFVNLLAPGSQEAAGGRRAGRRGTVPPIAVDLCADTPSPGTARKRASRRGSGGGGGAGGAQGAIGSPCGGAPPAPGDAPVVLDLT